MDGQIVDILGFALDAVSAQQRAIAANVANAQTPGYTAVDVGFHHSLARALADGGVASVAVTSSAAPPATDGNNVDLAAQLVDAQETTLEYQQITHSLNAQFLLVQGAAGGSFQ